MASRPASFPFLSACLILASLAAARPASADPAKAEAAEHFDRGLAYVDEGQFSLAIVEFERAHALGNHFAPLYNLGLAYAAVGRYTDAVRALSSYLESGGSDIDETRRRSTRDFIAEYRSKIASLSITTAPPDAQVRLDGELRADPTAVEVDPGRHVVTARASGHSELTRVVELRAGERRKLDLALVPIAKRPAPSPPPRPAASPSVAARPGPDRTLSYVLGGVAVACGATAVGIAIHNETRFETWAETEATLPPPGDPLTSSQARTRARQEELRESIETWDTIALVTGVAAGATFAAATVVWFTAGDEHGPNVGLLVRGHGAELVGAF